MSLPSAQLQRLLETDYEDLVVLADILEQEKGFLATRDVSQLQATTERKQQLIKKIEANSRLKAKLLIDSGLNPVPGRIAELIRSRFEKSLVDLWAAVENQLKHCKEANLINGKIAQASAQRTNKLMAILRGQSSKPNLYGSKGYERSQATTYSLAKA